MSSKAYLYRIKLDPLNLIEAMKFYGLNKAEVRYYGDEILLFFKSDIDTLVKFPKGSKFAYCDFHHYEFMSGGWVNEVIND